MICMFAILRSICLQYWYFAVPYFIMSEIKSVHKGRHPVLMGIPDENLTGENHEQFVSEWNSESEGKSEAGFTHRRRAEKVELPLKLLVAGDFSNGQEERPLSERTKTDINKNNFNDVLADISPSVRLNVENTLASDGSEESISLTFRNMNDFTPEQVARQIPRLKAMLAMRSLLRDLKLICWITPLFVRNWKNPAWSCAEPGVT